MIWDKWTVVKKGKCFIQDIYMRMILDLEHICAIEQNNMRVYTYD